MGCSEQRIREELIQKVIRQKELEILQNMSLEELRTLDPSKPIISKPVKLVGEIEEEVPTEEETELPSSPPVTPSTPPVAPPAKSTPSPPTTK